MPETNNLPGSNQEVNPVLEAIEGLVASIRSGHTPPAEIDISSLDEANLDQEFWLRASGFSA